MLYVGLCWALAPLDRRMVTTGMIAAPAASQLQYVPIKSDVRPSAALAVVDRIYGSAFTAYLSRVLLSYDGDSSLWLSAQKNARRTGAVESFQASLVLSLARNFGEARGPEQLLRRLEARPVFAKIIARRQLALAFSLCARQPAAAVEKLVAETANCSVVDIDVEDRGAGYAADQAVKATVGGVATTATLRPGRVTSIRVVYGGFGYERAPKVKGARAIVENGTVVSIQLANPIALGGKAPSLQVDAPPDGRRARLQAVVDYEVDRILVPAGMTGIASNAPPSVVVAAPARGRAAKARAVLSEANYEDVEAPPLLEAVTRPPVFRSQRWTYPSAADIRGRPLRELGAAVKRDVRPTIEQFATISLCGGIGSSASNLICTPIAVVKTKQQMGDATPPATLFAGAQALAAGSFVAGAAFFGVSALIRYSIEGDSTRMVAASVGATLVATVFFAPFESARVAAMAAPKQPPNLVTAWGIAVRDGGVAALFTAFDALLARDLAFGLIQLAIYDLSRRGLYAAWPTLRETFETSLATCSLAALLAGFAAAWITHPADAAYTRLAIADAYNATAPRLVRTVADIYSSSGVDGLFAGASARAVIAGANFALQSVCRSLPFQPILR